MFSSTQAFYLNRLQCLTSLNTSLTYSPRRNISLFLNRELIVVFDFLAIKELMKKGNFPRTINVVMV